jgi:2-amino-4-hydroxy-6-hydroxymethyldihydropteridine diphosphokinase
LTRAYVGLGANLGDREATIRRAVELLGAEPGVEVVAVSTLRETDPVGYADQPRFLNGAAAVVTRLSAPELLERLLAVERELGRVRGEGPRYGPRAIDLDLLLFGREVVDEPGLSVPHPRLAERAFVLEPLHELDPGLRLPDGRAVRELLEAQLQ